MGFRIVKMEKGWMCETYVVVLSRENDDLIKLGYICKEVVNAGSLRCSPAMLTLMKARLSPTRGVDLFRDGLTSHVEVVSRSSMEMRSVYGFWWGGGYGGGSNSGHAGLLKYYDGHQNSYEGLRAVSRQIDP